MKQIVDVHYPGIKQELVSAALGLLRSARTAGLKETINQRTDRLDQTAARRDVDPRRAARKISASAGAALRRGAQNEQDTELFQKLFSWRDLG